MASEAIGHTFPAAVRARAARDGWRAVCAAALMTAVLALVAAMPAAAQSGIVEGRLVNRTDARMVPAGADVDVIQLAGGMRVLQSVKTDAAGRFRVAGVPTDSRVMVQATYRSVRYHQIADFDASGTARVEIPVYETTGSMKDVRVQDVRIAFQYDGDRLRCLESYSLENAADPPRTIVPEEGSFRFSKAPGILEVPRMSVIAPGATFPLTEAPLESADGTSYYSLYPLRPGVTTFEIEQALPYASRSYAYEKKFYQDVEKLDIGVIPADMEVSGAGLARVQTDREHNFAIYSAGPIRANATVVWTFSGGTPVPGARSESTSGLGRIVPMPGRAGRNAMVIGPLLLLGFILALWLSIGREGAPAAEWERRTRALEERREQLIHYLAVLDHRFESGAVDAREYSMLRERGKNQLRRIAALLGNRQA